MYLNSTHATSQTARFRMLALYLESAAGSRFEGRVNAGAVAVRINGVTPASFKDAASGVRAWSPPV